MDPRPPAGQVPADRVPVPGLRQRLFAWGLYRGTRTYERFMAARKLQLFSGVTGTVLEIGPGAGSNLAYLLPEVRWIGVDPNPATHDYLRREAQRLGRQAEVRYGVAEELAAADASVDFVVSTLVLCSVAQPRQALREVLRVLKPGGALLFVEHVAAPAGSWHRQLQGCLRPVWKLAADGCHPDRDTPLLIESAGFRRVEYERFRAPLPVVSPHVAGRAVK